MLKLLAGILVLSGLLLAGPAAAGAASGAQTYPPNPSGTICDYFSLGFSSNPGLPGQTIQVSGEMPANDINDTGITLLWDGQDIGAQVQTDGISSIFGSFTVPAGAAPGAHTVSLYLPYQDNTICPYSFTVAGGVQEQAYAAAPLTTLPSTGFFLLIPASGMGFAAGGIFLARRRKA